MADIYQKGTLYPYIPLTEDMQGILRSDKGVVGGDNGYTRGDYAKTLHERFRLAVQNGSVEPLDCESESWSIGFEITPGDMCYLFDEDGLFDDHEAWLLQQFLLDIDRREVPVIVYEYGAIGSKLRQGYAYGGICIITREDIIWESTMSMETMWLDRLGYGGCGRAFPGVRSWEDDFTQFSRLLAEIIATQELDLPALAKSMDLRVDDVNSMFDRVDAAWEKIKGNHHI